MSTAALVIVGLGRSGTSLLHAALGTHTEIAARPETAFFRRYVVPGRLDRAARRGGAAAVRKALDGDPILGRIPITLDGIDPGPSGSWDLAVYRRLYAEDAAAEGKAYFADKDPRLIEHLPEVDRLLPGARIVHIVRDPRAVLASRMRAAWSRGRTLGRNLLPGRVQLGLLERAAGGPLGNRVTEVLFEDLVSAPEATLTALCHSLDLAFEPGMLDHRAVAARLMSPTERQWKGETLHLPDPSRIDAWRRELSPFQLAACEKVFEEVFRTRGYEPTHAARDLDSFDRIRLGTLVAGVRTAARIVLAGRHSRRRSGAA